MLNLSVPSINGGEPFNMFFISPYYECPLPVLSIIHEAAPYVVFLLVYVVGFSALSFVVYNVIYYISYLANHASKPIDDNVVLE